MGTTKEESFHEIGHLIEKNMMKPMDVRKYKEFLVDGLTYSDIIVKNIMTRLVMVWKYSC